MSHPNDQILEGYLKSGTLTDMFGDLEGPEPTGQDVSNLLTYPIDLRNPDDTIKNPFIDRTSHYLEKPEYTFDYTGLTVNEIPDLFDAFSRLYLFQMLPKSYLQQAVAPKIPMDNTIYYMMQNHLLQTLEKPDGLWAYTEESATFLSNLLVAMFFNPKVDVSTFYPVLQKLAEDQPEKPTVKDMFISLLPKFEDIYNFVDLDPDFYRKYATLSEMKQEIPKTDLSKFIVKPTKYFRTLLPNPTYTQWGSYLGEPYKAGSQFVQEESTTTISPREAIIFGIDSFLPKNLVGFAPINYTELVLASVYNTSTRAWQIIKQHVPKQRSFLVSFDGKKIEPKTFKTTPTNYPIAFSRPDNECDVTVTVDPIKQIIQIPTLFNPLIIAAGQNNPVATKTILEVAPQSGLVVNSNGITALNVATRASHNKDIIKRLLPISNVAYGSENGTTPLINTVINFERYPDQLDDILERLSPQQINWYQPNGRTNVTALVMAVRLNREEDVEKLIAAGANTNLLAPLIAAIEQKNETNFMRILLTVNEAARQGVDPQYDGLTQVDVTLDEQTPLNTAIAYNMPLAVKVLISAGAEVNAAVLGEAISRGKIEVLAIIMAQFTPSERKAIFAEKKYQYYQDRIDEAKKYLKAHPDIRKIKVIDNPIELIEQYEQGRTFGVEDMESEDIEMAEPIGIDLDKLKISIGHQGYTRRELREWATEHGVATTNNMRKVQLVSLIEQKLRQLGWIIGTGGFDM